MSRKHVIILVVALAILAVGIAAAVATLYTSSSRDAREPLRTPAVERFPLLGAVPSDAAEIFCFDGSEAAQDLLRDSSGVLISIIAPKAGAAFREYLAAVGDAPTVISLHNSGTFIPLIITALKGRDPGHITGLTEIADRAGLKSAWLADAGLLLSSRSETLLGSSRRHFSEGISILDADGMAEAAALISSGNALFIDNGYLPRLAQPILTQPYRSYAAFFKTVASWTAFSLSTSDALVLTGTAVTDDTGDYFHVLKAAPGELRFPEMLPFSTASAVALSSADLQAYIAARKRYLDVHGQLDRFGKRVDSFAAQLGVREAAVARFPLEGRDEEVLLIRCAKKVTSQRVLRTNGHATVPSVLYGSRFSVSDETACAGIGDWLVIGREAVVEAYIRGELPGNTLKAWLADAGVTAFGAKNLTAAAYLSPAEVPVSDIFQPPVSKALETVLTGKVRVPVTFTVAADRRSPVMTLRAREVQFSRTPAYEAARDTDIVVPAGPWKVRNCGTGQVNTFYQNSSMSLCLNDENGRGLWGIPFKTPICGRVEEVDFYGNGKIQFLFASADRLYLLDRLGRYVNGFPVQLPKPVRLGPDVYDFSGVHSYRALVLHTDNTVGMYDLRGRVPEGWKGITAPETIKGLPDLVEYHGRKWWAVQTASDLLFFEFNGGEPVPKREARKMRKDLQL